MTAPRGYTVATMKDHIGHDFGQTDTVKTTQHQINTFADVTGDHQWIHTNPVMAKKKSPFGGTVAHGFLTQSLVAPLMQSAQVIPSDAKGALNYGTDKVRFLSPVKTGSELQGQFVLKDVREKGKDQYLIFVDATLTVPGAPKPAMVGTFLLMVMG